MTAFILGVVCGGVVVAIGCLVFLSWLLSGMFRRFGG